MVRAVVHSDREALYVFQLKYTDSDTTIPNMVENGEVGLLTQPCRWLNFVAPCYDLTYVLVGIAGILRHADLLPCPLVSYTINVWTGHQL